MSVQLYLGDCRDVMASMEPDTFDSIVTDPPYGLAFMGKDWDHGVPGVAFWQAALRVAKPGAHLLAFGGTRTFHRLAVAIEDAGWEIRDTVMWVYGSGFPKSHDVGKAIDKAAGAEREKVRFAPRAETSGTMAGSSDTRPWIEKSRELGYHEVAGPTPATDAARQWHGWGTALKPAWEPIIVARKPLVGTVAANVLAHGTGALNIDGCRVPGWKPQVTQGVNSNASSFNVAKERRVSGDSNEGRWPANLIHDGSDEVLAGFPKAGGGSFKGPTARKRNNGLGLGTDDERHGASNAPDNYGDSGSAARFFYCPKASKSERGEGNHHPTVKPTDLMRYLCRLVTQPGGVVLDPFMGSGSTGKAARLEGFAFVGIDREAEYLEIARRRIAAVELPLLVEVPL